ncbi:MAG TPA: DUF72 domain-containing protein [Rudaea sp.]|nr:DUF72 domain-containing protein [Rudaea sp.]
MPSKNVKSQASTTAARIRIGVGGWNFAPWRNNFYPAGLTQQRELEFASRQLTAIEVNSTYYAAQKPATYANWRRQTPDGFRFSLKAPRYATAAKVLANSGKSINAFVFGGLAELGDRLGPISWQFMPTRRFDREDLSAFLDLLPRELDGAPLQHVLEVRHDSFMCADYLALARKHRVATVFTDSTEYPSIADVTGDFIYARLMRSETSITTGYADAALDAWASRARAWASGGEPDDLPRVGAVNKPSSQAPRDVYIYFIGSAKERNPAAAMSLIARVRAQRQAPMRKA